MADALNETLAPAPVPASAGAAGGGGERRRILFAADDPGLRDAARAHFRERGDEVTALASDAEALSRLSSSDSTYDVIVAALEGRKKQSFGVLSALREREDAPPAIAITAPEDQEAIDRALDLGAASFLARPVSWRLLDHQIAFVARAAGRVEASGREAVTLLAKSRAVAAMRHEFRTPLNGVVGYAEMIAMRAHKAKEETTERFANHIMTAARRLTDTLDDLLLYAEITGGEANLETAPLSAELLIRLALERLEDPAAAQKACEIAASPLTLRVDPYYFTAGLAHLVMNALQFAAGPIKILATPILGEGPNETRLRGASLAVIDRGRGIDPAAPGFSAERADPLATPSGRGAEEHNGVGRDHLGLGFAMARAVAALHGGALKIGANPWGGLSAVIVLPAGAVER